MSVAANRITSNRRIAAQSSDLPSDVNLRGARGRVLVSALHLFADLGYGGTSVRDICAQAGVQPTTLYAHFPSKEDVLAELLRIGHEEHLSRLQSALLDVDPDPATQLRALVRAHVSSHCQYPMLAVVASAELHALSEDKSQSILAIRRQSESLLVEVLQRGIAREQFQVTDTLLTLRAISAIGTRVAFWFSPDCGRSVEQVADQFAEFAARIVGLPPTL